MAKSSNNELNKEARLWLYKEHKDLLLKEDTLVLAARPHIFKVKRSGRTHAYDRWTWNVHVHGKNRKEAKNFLLTQHQHDMSVIDVFYVPYKVAMLRKSIALYHAQKPQRSKQSGGWLEKYSLTSGYSA